MLAAMLDTLDVASTTPGILLLQYSCVLSKLPELSVDGSKVPFSYATTGRSAAAIGYDWDRWLGPISPASDGHKYILIVVGYFTR